MASLRKWEWVGWVFDPNVYEFRPGLQRVYDLLGYADNRERRADLEMGDLCLPDLPVVAINDVGSCRADGGRTHSQQRPHERLRNPLHVVAPLEHRYVLIQVHLVHSP